MSARSIGETESLRKVGFAFAVFLTLLLVGFITLSLTYRPRSRLFPLLVAVPTFLCMTLVVLSYFSERAERVSAKFNAAFFETDAEMFEEDTNALEEENIGRSIAWVVLTLVAFYLFGFALTTFAFAYAYMTVEGDHSRGTSAILALLTTASAYALFVVTFGVRLDGGAVIVLLFDLLGM